VAVAEGAFGEFGAFEVEFGGFDAGGGVVDANLFHTGLFFYKDKILFTYKGASQERVRRVNIAYPNNIS